MQVSSIIPMLISLTKVLMKQSTSIRKPVSYTKIISLAQMLKTCLTGALTYQRSKHIIKEYLFKPLRLVYKVFLEHGGTAYDVVVFLHRPAVLDLS